MKQDTKFNIDGKEVTLSELITMFRFAQYIIALANLYKLLLEKQKEKNQA